MMKSPGKIMVQVGDQLEFKAELAEAGLGLLNGQFRPQLDLLPQGGLGPGEGGHGGDLDDVGLGQG